MVGLGYLPGGQPDSRAYGISANGQVLVWASSCTQGRQAFRWTAQEGMVGLGCLAGGSFTSFAERASSDGSVIVGESDSASGIEAFRWTAQAGMVSLGELPGSAGSRAYGVSADGSIVVGGADVDNFNSSGNRAFIGDDLHGMRDLQTVLVDDYGLDLTGWSLSTARDVSADGRAIVGWGVNPAGDMEAWIVTVPEPVALSLVAIGGLALTRRRRMS